jgi:hypothetical protein
MAERMTYANLVAQWEQDSGRAYTLSSLTSLYWGGPRGGWTPLIEGRLVLKHSSAEATDTEGGSTNE